jgi:hypothetical protein
MYSEKDFLGVVTGSELKFGLSEKHAKFEKISLVGLTNH